MAKEIKCPQCGKLTVYDPSNAYRPFCSERCQLIDLGSWAEEKYTIPVNDPTTEWDEINPESDEDDPTNLPDFRLH